MKTVLKTILGEQYEELGQPILDEVGKRFVPKADFNKVNEEKKLLELQAEKLEQELKDTAEKAGGEDLKDKLAELQAELESERKGREQDKLESVLERSLADAGAVNMTAAKAVVMEQLKELKLTEDEKGIDGLPDVLEKLQKDESSQILFSAKEKKPDMQGFVPGEKADTKPGENAGNPPASLADAVKAAFEKGE